MKNYNPFFQLEIRYTPILDFRLNNRKLIAPYVKLASQIRIDNENSVNETIQLIFDDEKFVIYISWDRIFIRGQGQIEKYTKNNTSIQNCFFKILDDIKSISSFYKVDRYLILITTVSINNDNQPVNKLLNHYFKDNVLGVLPSVSDFAITLKEKTTGENEITCEFGPYFGMVDLINRPTKPNFELPAEFDSNGFYSEIKIFKRESNINFSEFKELVNEYERIYSNLWR